MLKIEIANKAFDELHGMTSEDLSTAISLRKALVHGPHRVKHVASLLSEMSVGKRHNEVGKGLDLLVASRHGDLLRERVVNVHVHESDDDWVDDGLLIECGTGYLSVYCTASERVFDVLEPKDLRDSNYGLHDVADAVEQVRLFLDHDGGVDESEMEDENGNAWCKFDQSWDGDNDAYEGEE